MFTKILLGIAWLSGIIFMFAIIGIVKKDKQDYDQKYGVKVGDTIKIKSQILIIDSVRNDTAFYHFGDTSKSKK